MKGVKLGRGMYCVHCEVMGESEIVMGESEIVMGRVR